MELPQLFPFFRIATVVVRFDQCLVESRLLYGTNFFQLIEEALPGLLWETPGNSGQRGSRDVPSEQLVL